MVLALFALLWGLTVFLVKTLCRRCGWDTPTDFWIEPRPRIQKDGPDAMSMFVALAWSMEQNQKDPEHRWFLGLINHGHLKEVLHLPMVGHVCPMGFTVELLTWKSASTGETLVLLDADDGVGDDILEQKDETTGEFRPGAISTDRTWCPG